MTDAHQFTKHLEKRGLAVSTQKNYRIGANALIKALSMTATTPPTKSTYPSPFQGLQYPRKPKKKLEIEPEKLQEVANPITRAKLGVLLALLDLGLSIPEACTRTWNDIDKTSLTLKGYHQTFRMGVPVLEAIEHLTEETPQAKHYSFQRIMKWKPEAARRWLKFLTRK